MDICLEMFKCVPAEQTVVMRKAKFLKRVIVILATCCVRHLLLKPPKNWRLIKSCILVKLLQLSFYCSPALVNYK